MNISQKIFRKYYLTLFVIVIVNLILTSVVFAQSTLDQLEEQIRERVSPAQEGTQSGRTVVPAPPPAPQEQSTVPQRLERDTASSVPVYLGLTADDRRDRGRGVRITNVQPDSPADKAGLRKQDLIIGLADARVRQLSEMTDMLSVYQPGDAVEFEIIRAGMSQKVKVTLGSRPTTPAATIRSPETIPPPPAEPMLPENTPAVKPPTTTKANYPSDRETIEQLQNRVTELERRVNDLERILADMKKKD